MGLEGSCSTDFMLSSQASLGLEASAFCPGGVMAHMGSRFGVQDSFETASKQCHVLLRLQRQTFSPV